MYGRDYTSSNNSAGIVPPRDITIIGGDFSDQTTAAGIYIGDYGSAPGGETYLSPTNISITAAIIKNNPGNGIAIQRCDTVTIEGNVFSGNTGEAIYANQTNALRVSVGLNSSSQ